jgi:hypothetical protein
MDHAATERQWYVFATLPNGEPLVPGETAGCPGPDAWGACPAVVAGEEPGCAGATWYYGPEPSWRFEATTVSGMCPLVMFDPLGPLSTPLD